MPWVVRSTERDMLEETKDEDGREGRAGMMMETAAV